MRASTRFALIFSLILGSACWLTAQGIPTLDQCHADKKAWDDQLVLYKADQQALMRSAQPTLNSEILKVPLRELSRRIDEMATCAFIEQKDHPDYYRETVTGLHEAFVDRYVFFVLRHHLEQQLFKEDDEGQR